MKRRFERTNLEDLKDKAKQLETIKQQYRTLLEMNELLEKEQIKLKAESTTSNLQLKELKDKVEDLESWKQERIDIQRKNKLVQVNMDQPSSLNESVTSFDFHYHGTTASKGSRSSTSRKKENSKNLSKRSKDEIQELSKQDVEITQ